MQQFYLQQFSVLHLWEVRVMYRRQEIHPVSDFRQLVQKKEMR